MHFDNRLSKQLDKD